MASFVVNEYEVKYGKTRKNIMVSNLGYCETQQQATDIARKLISNKPYETLLVLAINGGNRIVGYNISSVGTANRSSVYLRNIFHFLFQVNAVSFIIAHNHPGGNLKPSENDLCFTRALGNAGMMLNLELLDHIIVNKDSALSIRTTIGKVW